MPRETNVEVQRPRWVGDLAVVCVEHGMAKSLVDAWTATAMSSAGATGARVLAAAESPAWSSPGLQTLSSDDPAHAFVTRRFGLTGVCILHGPLALGASVVVALPAMPTTEDRDHWQFAIAQLDRALGALRTRLFLETVVEHLPDMVFVKDARELRFLYFNRAGEQLVGHPRRDLIGRNDHDFFPPGEAEFFIEKDREVLASGRLVEIPEEPIHTTHGTRILHTKKIPVADENGRPIFLLGISEDITDRVRARERLAERERAFETFFERAPVALFRLNATAARASLEASPSTPAPEQVRIIAQNAEARALCQRLGLEALDHLGHLSQSPDELARLWSSLTDTLADRDRPVAPLPINAPTYGDVERGETVHVLPRFSVPRGAANPLDELVLALTDVTALRQTELALGRTTRDLERTHADLAQVSWAAAHDLNEPLKAALGFAELFDAQHRDALTHDAAAVFDAVHQSVRRVQLLLRDLLAYTRLQAYPEDRERFSLALPLQDALGQLDAELRAGEAVVRLEPAAAEWPEVEGDRTALSLVFRHLVENASKFRGATPPRIDVRCERQPGVVHVDVTDDGIGFPPEFALRIFEVFQRLHTSSEYAGTGMGLAICRRIVTGHGGQIHARSRARQGATFTFTLPACGPDAFDDASLVPQS